MSHHRAHKSTKVPNVKLRPVAKTHTSSSHLDDLSLNRTLEAQYAQRDLQSDRRSKKRKVDRGSAAHDGDEEHDDEDDNDNFPLRGTFFCFTGVGEEKTSLAQAAISLGATVDGDLTETTTHLIALECGSQKYKFALQLGLYILTPSFLYQLHERWRLAQPLVFNSLLEHHALPPLQGLVVGLSGISDASLKTSLKTRLTNMGARLEFPMTFDSGVTHLICGIADRKQSTTLDTVYQLRRGYVGTSEERKGATQLHCVWLDWVEDCDKVGGCIPEDEYDVWKPTTGNRKPKKPDMSLRAQVTSQFPPRDVAQMKRRCIEKMKENQETYVKALEHTQKTSKTSRQSKPSQPDRPAVTKESKPASRTSTPVDSTDHKKPAPSSKSTSGLLSMSRNVTEEERPQQKVQHRDTINTVSPSTSAGRPLAGTHIHIDLSQRDHNKLTRVREACVDAGARLILDDSQWAGALNNDASRAFILVSVLCPSKQRAEQAEERRRLQQDYKLSEGAVPLVTLSWLEQCIHWNRLIDPRHVGETDPKGYPYLPIITAPDASLTLPLQHVQQYTIALTNFPPYDASPHRTQITQAFTQLGLQVTESFGRKQNTHLYSRFAETLKGMTGDEMEKWGKEHGVSVIKETKALLWDIPIVGIDFLKRLWQAGEVKPENDGRDVETQGLGPNQSVSVMEETQFGVPSDQADTSTGQPDTHKDGSVKAEQPTVDASSNSAVPKVEGDQKHTKTMPADTHTPTTSRNGTAACTRPEDSAAVQSIRPVLANESLAGQSMWATKMQDQVEALLASRGGTVSSSSTTDTLSAPRTKGKLPPKSRRSAGLNRSNTPGAGSPASVTRPGSISPLKSNVLTDDADATAPHQPSTDYEDEGAVEAETMRVTYRDPAAEKERRKLEELLERGGRERKIQQQEETEAPPAKAALPEESPPTPRRAGGGVDLYGTGKNRPPPPPTSSDQSPKKKIVARRQPGTRS